jgi:hypothetical protein
MLIKEEVTMKRVLYTLVVIAMLAVPTVALADEPQVVEQIPDGWWLLGELWWTPDALAATNLWNPFEPVDAYMTRPSTFDVDDEGNVIVVWPLTQAPIMGDWWLGMGASEQRRMSYAEDYFFANMFGGYYAEFMLPRDEVWFPCDWPLQWQCNFVVDPFTIEYHSPAAMAYECIQTDPWNLLCLDWPWAVAPYDTISPVVIDIFNTQAPYPWGVQYELEIAGMFWKFSDIP